MQITAVCEWFCPGSTSLELLKSAPTAVIASIAVYVAWRQWKVARQAQLASKAKVKLDLFDKRYELYVLIWTFLTFVGKEKNAHRAAEDMAELNNALPKFHFLFGSELGDFAEHVLEQGKELERQRRVLRQPATTAEARDAAMAQHDRLIDGLQTELLQLKNRFAPFLHFTEWRD